MKAAEPILVERVGMTGEGTMFCNLTVRDFFAAFALAGSKTPAQAYALADAMIAEREEAPPDLISAARDALHLLERDLGGIHQAEIRILRTAIQKAGGAL